MICNRIRSRARFSVLRTLFLFVVFAGAFLFTSQAHAAAGDVKLTILGPDSNPVSGAQVSVWCSGGDFTAFGTTDTNGVVAATPPVGSGCTDTTTIAFRVTKAGYLTLTTAPQDSFSRTYESTIDPEDAGTFDGSYHNTFSLVFYPLEAGNTDSYLAQYWTEYNGGIPEFPDASADFTTSTNTISYHLLDGAQPNDAIGYRYVVRFSKTGHFDAGDYTFNVCSDDGERTYIDGVLIGDYWYTRGRTCDANETVLTAGTHTVTLEYYQQGGGQSLDFSYGLTTIPAELDNGYESADTAVTPTAPGTQNDAYSRVASTDGSYWTTALSTNDSGYDTQLFNFKPNLSGITTPHVTATWTGHGAVPDGKKVYLSVWNFLSSSWDEITSGHCATDCTLTGAKEGAGYKDGEGNVWLMAKADNSYVPPVISGLTDNTGLLPIQWTTDQDTTTELAWDTESHTNFADYANHLDDSDLLTAHSMTPTVSDNNSQGWRSVAGSSDNTKLAAVVACGDIWTSTNSGADWTDQTGAGSRCWMSIASSADGNTLVAVESNGDAWSGTYDGTSWTWTNLSTISTNYPGQLDWNTVALSADNSNGGWKLALQGWGSGLWTAVNASGTWVWTQQTGFIPTSSQGMGMSADGNTIVSGQWCGDIWVGKYDGTSWTWSDQGDTSGCWYSFSVSADGTKILAGENGNSPLVGTYDGTNWTWNSPASIYGWWESTAMSADGTYLAAGSYCGPVITSNDGGLSWTTQNGSGSHCWDGLHISNDGTKIAASASSSDVFISNDSGVTWTSATGTKWYYRVKSVNANGQAVISDEQSFHFASTNSCPFVFTWDGSKYQFVIDASNSGNLGVGLDRLLWDASPWYKDPNANNGYPNPVSYTKIPNNGLVARTVGNETYYDIKTSTELDEVNYYEKAALQVVDHDPSVDIYPDYRNNGQLHSIAKTAPAPVSVTDESGRDVKSLIASDDNQYWHSRLAGSANDATYLTIKLTNDVMTPANLKLLIKGTKEGPLSGGKGSDKLQYENSSGQFVNVPTSKDIFVVTRAGAPHASRNLMNTYGVQYKVIDLSGLTIKDNTIRLVTTNTQRQWDIDWLAVDANADSIGAVTTETPYYADLHERGISAMTLSNPNDPRMAVQEPIYDQLVKSKGEGFPLTGNATRYGDVVPLLANVDNKFVIMTQGDELALKYAVPTEADGTTRDFIYYTWDYHKPHHDALGHTIAPLPFNEMTSYPYHEDQEHYPTDSDHQTYQATYNTRVINWGTVQQNGNQIHHSLNTDFIGMTVTDGTPVVVARTSGHPPVGAMGGGFTLAIPVTQSIASTQVAQSTATQSPATGGASGASGAPTVFLRDLKKGKTNTDVLRLEQFLNTKGFTVAPSGAGSVGKESNYFGPKTSKALAKFQKSVGLPATGYFGSMTRKYINDMIASGK